jgi:hypothetical protein
MTPSKLQSRRAKDDILVRAANRLDHALTEEAPGRERTWAETVGAALVDVENGLRQYQAAAETPNGPLAEVDQTRPTLRRQSAGWRHELARLLELCTSLQAEVRRAAGAFQATADTLLERTSAQGVPVFGDIRRRAEELAAGLCHCKETEAGMVLESINTDLGAGD